MNKTFKILWFEDDEDWREPIEDVINENLFRKFLEPDAHIFKSAEEFDISSIEKSDYDLILVDNYLFDNNCKGSDLISKIRKNQILIDVLFYSSKYDELLTYLKTNLSDDINGVYITKRDNELFTEKVCKLIEKNIRRTENICNFRGIVMDSTADFETIVESRLTELYTNISEDKQEILNNIVIDSIETPLITEISHILEKFKDKKYSFIQYNEKPKGFTMNDRLKIFKEFSEQINVPLIINGQNIQEYYMDSIGTYRNKLGHLKVGDTIKIKGIEEPIDQAFYQKLRGRIKEVDDNLDSTLENFVNNVKNS